MRSDEEGDHNNGSSGRKKSQRKMESSQKKRAKRGELQRPEEEEMPLKLTKDLKESSSKKKDKKKKRKLRNKEDTEERPAKRTNNSKKKQNVNSSSTVSRKRSKREEDPHLEEEEGPSKRQAKALDVLFRLVVPSSKLGKVIGKQGSRIQQLREETGAHIKIADPINNVDERVVLILSKEEPLESQSAAERALLRVATLLMEPETEDKETAAAEICLLIAGSQAGSVIGKAGVAINEIRESSGANVRILTKEQFSLCAFASETDRLVRMEGEISQVQRALELIAVRLRESPPGKVDVKRRRVSVRSGGASKTSVKINIRSDLIPKLIGKNGVNIKQIREQCGVFIKVNESEDDAGEGTVLLKGTLSKVTTAQTLLQAFLAAKQKAG